MNNQLVFGLADINAYVDGVRNSLTFKFSGPQMCIMSVLSDAQELLALGHSERARQEINRAKFLLTEFFPSEREKDVPSDGPVYAEDGAPKWTPPRMPESSLHGRTGKHKA